MTPPSLRYYTLGGKVEKADLECCVFYRELRMRSRTRMVFTFSLASNKVSVYCSCSYTVITGAATPALPQTRPAVLRLSSPPPFQMGSSTSGSGGAPGGPLGVGPRMGAAPQQAFGAAAAVPAAGAFSLNGAGGGGGGAVSRLPAAAAAPGGPVGSRESQLISGGGIMDYAAASQPSGIRSPPGEQGTGT